MLKKKKSLVFFNLASVVKCDISRQQRVETAADEPSTIIYIRNKNHYLKH